MPETRYIISRGVYIRNGKAAEKSRLPTGVEIQVVSTQRAKEVLGVEAHLIGGNTVRLYQSLLNKAPCAKG